MTEVPPGTGVYIGEMTQTRLTNVKSGVQAVRILMPQLFSKHQMLHGTLSCSNPQTRGDLQVLDPRIIDAILSEFHPDYSLHALRPVKT